MKRVRGGKSHVDAVLSAAKLCEFHAMRAFYCREEGSPGAGLAHDMCAADYSRSAVIHARELQQLGAFA